MWPFYFLLNKILKPEEEGQVHVSEVNPASMLECCRSEQSPSNGKCSDAVLPTAYFVEVSEF